MSSANGISDRSVCGMDGMGRTGTEIVLNGGIATRDRSSASRCSSRLQNTLKCAKDRKLMIPVCKSSGP